MNNQPIKAGEGWEKELYELWDSDAPDDSSYLNIVLFIKGLPKDRLEREMDACDGFVALRKNEDRTYAAFGGNENYPESSCEKHGKTPLEAVLALKEALLKNI